LLGFKGLKLDTVSLPEPNGFTAVKPQYNIRDDRISLRAGLATQLLGFKGLKLDIVSLPEPDGFTAVKP